MITWTEMLFHSAQRTIYNSCICKKSFRCHYLSYASRGNFKDGVRYGKFGPVGSDKKTEEERNHSSRHFLKFKRNRMLVTLIYWSVCPVVFGSVMLLNWYKGTKAFKSDSVLK